MEGLSAILEHILARAQEQVSQIESTTKEQIRLIQQQTTDTCQAILQTADIQSDSAVEAIMNRATSQAALESRRLALDVRQHLINETIEQTLVKLGQLNDDDKVKLYTQLILASGATSGEITLNQNDARTIGSRLAKAFPAMTLAPAAGTFTGGLVIRRGRIEDNLTFDLLIRNQRPQLAALAAGVLFPAHA